jgi:hypothetical protein
MQRLKQVIILLFLLAASAFSENYFYAADWLGDSTTEVDPALTLYAYNFGSDTDVYINNVLFQGTDGDNPSVSGRFAVAGFSDQASHDSHNLTDSGSGSLADRFIYGATSGTLTVQGLTVGTAYRLSMYSVAYGDGTRVNAVESSTGESKMFDQNAAGENDGIRIDYLFTATSTSETINILVYNANNDTFHVHGFALSQTCVKDDATSPNHYVSTEGSATWPYTSWDTAATSLQMAINTATEGDLITVDDGTYYQGVVITNSLFMLKSRNGADSCTLSGYGNKRTLYLDGKITVDGFTITDGYVSDGDGAGVYCKSSDVKLLNCVISDNRTGENGGGIYGGYLTDCTITGNEGEYAGGCYGSTLVDCIISENQANKCGGGTYGGSLTNCIIFNNTAENQSGGCHSGLLTGCVVSNNIAGAEGGGCSGGRLNECQIVNNRSYTVGGGTHNGIQNNCLIANNSAADGGGGSSAGDLNGCTVVGNDSEANGGGLYIGSVTNCIIYFNTANGSGDNVYPTNKFLSHCCTVPLTGNGVGNITNNPCFTDADNGDYTLLPSSPCIDAGVDVETMIDLAGNLRPVDGDSDYVAQYDMGAYEYISLYTDTDAFDAFAWTGDSTVDVDTNYTLYAYSFGTDGDDFTINGMTFTAVDGANPAVDGVFSVSDQSGVYHYSNNVNIDDHALTDAGSAMLADHFNYGGDPCTFTLEGLTPGLAYTLSLYSVGWDGSVPRYIIFSDGTSTERIDQNRYGCGEGICITYSFVAEASTQSITTAPESDDLSFHFHGFSLNGPKPQHTGDSPTHYVSTTGSNDWPYASWSTAARSVQDAVAVAMDGDTVLVAEGTYEFDSAVVITNAISLESVGGAAMTTLDGQGKDRVLYLDNEIAVDGFTITNGYSDSEGGGIYCAFWSEVTVIDCTISGNIASKGGGCMRGTLIDCSIIGNTALSQGGGCNYCALTNCIVSGNQTTSEYGQGGGCAYGTQAQCMISNNDSTYKAGGCYFGTQIDCTISGNSSTFGGGCYSGTQTDCSLFENSSTAGGGGCYLSASYNCLIVSNSCDNVGGGCNYGSQTKCTISGNYSGWGGGGLHTCVADRCVIEDNTTDQAGGGCSFGSESGCLISENYAGGSGGGVYSTSATNCTIVSNTCYVAGGGASDGTLKNCIVYLNTAHIQDDNINDASCVYCCSTPSQSGTGNIDADPCFASDGDYSLLITSPCIDAGLDYDMDVDLVGTACPLDGDNDGTAIADMGAYEYVNVASDTDGDGENDADEEEAGTSPIDADDYFYITLIDSDTVSFLTSEERLYTLQVSTNLTTGTWSSITNTSGTGTDELLSDPDADKSAAFYRVSVEME